MKLQWLRLHGFRLLPLWAGLSLHCFGVWLACADTGMEPAVANTQTSNSSGPAEGLKPPPIARKPVAVWDTLVRVSVDAGYRENVLRTSVAPEESAFFHTAGEASFIRLSEIGSQYSLFGLAEDWRYPGCESIDSEQIASATAQGVWPLGASQEVTAELQYLYQNQVMDLSETDTLLRRLKVEGHGLYARPRWRLNFSSGWAVQLEGAALRQIYAGEEVDDFWEGAGRVSLLKKYGNRSEASGYFQIANRRFDTWEQYELSGEVIADSNLEYWRPELGMQLRHFWDKDRHWRTITRLSYLWNEDNGTGYFNFGRAYFYQQIRWNSGPWELRAGARAGWYQYEEQFISGEKRERSYIIADVRFERRFGKHFFVFVAGEREWDFSNDPLDEYQDSWGSGGLGIEF